MKEKLKMRLVAKLRKMIYEPEHDTGGVCWCGVTWVKEKDGKAHIYHKEQRNILPSFLEKAFDEIWEKAQEEEQDKILSTQFSPNQ